jgi:hypothetical protein
VTDDTHPGLSDAKQTLLRALEEIENCEEEMDASVGYLTVVYSVHGKLDEDGGVHEQGGWVSTNEPSWVTAAMLRRAADALEGAVVVADDED